LRGRLYIYGAIPTSDHLAFDTPGLAGDELVTILGDAVALVVSQAPVEDVRTVARDEVLRALVTHQRAVEALLARYPVLPVKFGTTLADANQARALLAQAGRRFRAALVALDGLRQYEVVATLDMPRVFGEIGAQPEVARLKEQVASLPDEQQHVGRMLVGQVVKAALDRRRDALREQIEPFLSASARAAASGPLRDDEMVLNLALLLDAAGLDAVEQQLDTLDAAHAGLLSFRLIGPLPPYSFATVEVAVADPLTIARSCALLALPAVVPADEIRRAYRRRAAEVHPDHQPAQAEAMAEMTHAYELLSTYAESHPANAVDFRTEAAERTLIVTIPHRRFGEA